MTYGVARAATSPELSLYRSPGKWSKWRAAILMPRVVYRARINQTFSSTDGVLELIYDGGSGNLADVLPDMEMYVGSSLDANDLGIVRLRASDGTKFYIEETSDIRFANDLYLTVVESFALRARHVRISSGVPYMDGGVAYSDQHSNPDPIPIMGSHRVLKLTGASVSTQFDWSSSYVIGGLSTITDYATSAPTASAIDDPTSQTPTVTFDATGWHPVYLTCTTDGAKSFFGVRWVYVWSDADQPQSVQISDPRQDVETGGWEFEIVAAEGVDLDTVPDHALVILFAEDHFGGTQSDIGPVEGSENVEVTGWIAREVNQDNPEQPYTTFTVYTAHYWMAQIPAFPDGVEFTTATPTTWTQFQALTVDKGLWHFLHWRTTATRVMDVFLSGDTKYTAEVSSLGATLWEQIREMAWNQIYARAGCNAWNQLIIQVHPQLVPVASRTWATVMTITKADWREEISFERRTKPEVAVVSLSGVAVNESGVGASYFALSPGHVYPHYGRIDVQDRLLVASQAQANQLAGLYRSWQNNPYPDIPISLAADIRLIDCFPRSRCAITIDPADTPRGISYSGNLIPTAVTVVTDPETGTRYREVAFEAETGEDLSVNGDVPGGRADVSIPPVPRLPPLPAFPVILPGTSEPPTGNLRIVIKDVNQGLCYSENFDSISPNWRTINAGLSSAQYQAIDKVLITPSGGIYVASRGNAGIKPVFIAYAPSIGATFTVIEDYTSIGAKGWGFNPLARGVTAIGINPLTGQIAYVIAANQDPLNFDSRIYIGSGLSFALGTNLGTHVNSVGSLSYGFGNWRLTTNLNNVNPRFLALNAAATSVIRSVGMSGQTGLNASETHIPISTTDSILVYLSGGLLKITQNGAVVADFSTVIGSGLNYVGLFDVYADCDPTGMYVLASWDASAKRGRSTDGGATWAAIAGLPASNSYSYSCFGGTGAESVWAAGVGTNLYLSQNGGATWGNRIGDLTAIAPIPDIALVKAVPGG